MRLEIIYLIYQFDFLEILSYRHKLELVLVDISLIPHKISSILVLELHELPKNDTHKKVL